MKVAPLSAFWSYSWFNSLLTPLKNSQLRVFTIICQSKKLLNHSAFWLNDFPSFKWQSYEKKFQLGHLMIDQAYKNPHLLFKSLIHTIIWRQDLRLTHQQNYIIFFLANYWSPLDTYCTLWKKHRYKFGAISTVLYSRKAAGTKLFSREVSKFIFWGFCFVLTE